MKGKIGQRIHLARKFLNKSQEEFGAEMGVSQSRQSRIEKNETEIPTSYLERIMEKYGEFINEEWLLLGKGYMENLASDSLLTHQKSSQRKWTQKDVDDFKELLNDFKMNPNIPREVMFEVIKLFVEDRSDNSKEGN